MNVVRYLNVDCILRSEKKLSKFFSVLEGNIFILWNESSNGGTYAGFETNLVDTSGPQEDIAEFIKLFNSPPLLEDLIKCQEKIFDIGFESGDSGDPVDVVISPDLVNKISELGFSIKIRVYPVPQIQEGIET